MLIKQICRKNVIFVTFGILKMSMSYELYLCNGCHYLMQIAMSFNNVAVVYVKGNSYRIHFWYMSKDDARGGLNNFFIIYIK